MIGYTPVDDTTQRTVSAEVVVTADDKCRLRVHVACPYRVTLHDNGLLTALTDDLSGGRVVAKDARVMKD
jgi:hypothetical protein